MSYMDNRLVKIRTKPDLKSAIKSVQQALKINDITNSVTRNHINKDVSGVIVRFTSGSSKRSITIRNLKIPL